MFKFNFVVDEPEKVEEDPIMVEKNDLTVRNAPTGEYSNGVHDDAKSFIIHQELPALLANRAASASKNDLEKSNFRVLELADATQIKYIEDLDEKCDVKSGEYEGGRVVWECTKDLLAFLAAKTELEGKRVLDLGCGQGLLGIYALKKNAQLVHFSDYNDSVIDNVLTETLVANGFASEAQSDSSGFGNDKNILTIPKKRIIASSGDWDRLSKGLKEEFDIILTAETIYNEDYYERLFDAIDSTLAQSGVVYLAAKSHYFGCSGSAFGWSEYVKSRKSYTIDVIWSSSGEGELRRDILRMIKK